MTLKELKKELAQIRKSIGSKNEGKKANKENVTAMINNIKSIIKVPRVKVPRVKVPRVRRPLVGNVTMKRERKPREKRDPSTATSIVLYKKPRTEAQKGAAAKRKATIEAKRALALSKKAAASAKRAIKATK